MICLSIKSNRLIATGGFPQKEELKSVGFKWSTKEKYWWLTLNWDDIIACYELSLRLPMQTTPAVDKMFVSAKERLDNWNNTVAEIKRIKKSWSTDNPIVNYDKTVVPNGVKLFQHQEKVLTVLSKTKAAALFLSCGLGKTLTILCHLKSLMKKSLVGKILIVCPKSLIYGSWIPEIEKYFPELSTQPLLRGRDDNRLILKRKFAEAHPRIKNAKDYDKVHDVYLVSFESFPTLLNEAKFSSFDAVIVDESSKMKDHKSTITRSLLKLSNFIPYRYILSGTPAPNSPLEYWPQCRFLSSRLLGSNFYAFRNKYFEPHGFMGKQWIQSVDPSRNTELKTKVSMLAVRFKDTDVIDLPPQNFIDVKVKLSEDSSDTYKAAKQEAILRIKEQTLPIENPLSVLGKCRQLASGFVRIPKDGGEREELEIHTEKLKTLQEVLEQFSTEQAIVWVHHRYNIRKILELLEPNAVSLYSETKSTKESIEKFKNGACQYLVAHPRSAAHGLTLTNARYNVFFELDFSSETFEQLKKRTHRIGQTQPVFYYNLQSVLNDGSPTTDLVVQKTLNRKFKNTSEILDYFTCQ